MPRRLIESFEDFLKKNFMQSVMPKYDWDLCILEKPDLLTTPYRSNLTSAADFD